MMGPTSGNSATPESTECDGFALCTAGALLGWTAIDPCSGCVATAGRVNRGAATLTVNPRVDPALVVTGDEFERLLSQAVDARRASRTS